MSAQQNKYILGDLPFRNHNYRYLVVFAILTGREATDK